MKRFLALAIGFAFCVCMLRVGEITETTGTGLPAGSPAPPAATGTAAGQPPSPAPPQQPAAAPGDIPGLVAEAAAPEVLDSGPWGRQYLVHFDACLYDGKAQSLQQNGSYAVTMTLPVGLIIHDNARHMEIVGDYWLPDGGYLGYLKLTDMVSATYVAPPASVDEYVAAEQARKAQDTLDYNGVTSIYGKYAVAGGRTLYYSYDDQGASYWFALGNGWVVAIRFYQFTITPACWRDPAVYERILATIQPHAA